MLKIKKNEEEKERKTRQNKREDKREEDLAYFINGTSILIRSLIPWFIMFITEQYITFVYTLLFRNSCNGAKY